MALHAISPDSVRAALRAVRYGKPLSPNPLLALESVTLHLRAEGLPDTRQTREWALGAVLAATTQRELARLRGANGAAPAHKAGGGPDPSRELARLRQDFDSGVPDLEAWSALYIRYLSAAAIPLGEVASSLGVHERTLERRITRGHELLAAALADVEVKAQRDAQTFPGAPAAQRIVVDDSLVADVPAATLHALRTAVLDDHSVVHLNGHTADRIAEMPAATLEAYRLARIAEWSKPRYRLDERFVQLTLLLDQGEAMGERWQPGARFKDLRHALDAVPDRALVLLGPPGAGKSTLLRRLELDLSIHWLRSGADRVSLFVPLNHYRAEGMGADPPSPAAWLAERWHARFPQLPPLPELIGAGRLVLLLDALNEMPHSGFDHYHRLVMGWKSFLHRVLEDNPDNAVVFSCRSLDYSAPLSSQALRVPQVRIEPMSNDAVHTFLTLYSPALGEGIWQVLDGTPQLDLVRVPYFCRLLVEQVESDNRIPAGRAALFTGFVRQALRRELERDNPLFTTGPLLSPRDRRRLTDSRAWRSGHDLPVDGTLLPSLQRLAFGMQSTEDGREGAQVRVGVSEARGILASGPGESARGVATTGPVESVESGAADPDTLLRAGLSLAVLDEDPSGDDVMFFHQLLQEYFAARELAERPDPDLARVPWAARDVRPTVPEALALLDASAALPPLAASGWEETAVLAAGMAPHTNAFVADLALANVALAGRCAAEPEVRGQLAEATVAGLRTALARRAEDPAADLRARLDAAWQLGRLGDIRLTAASGVLGRFALGPFVEIAPQKNVEGFRIARYPVTNAAWALFIAAGGYDDERWWPRGTARDWQAGKGTARGSRDDYRQWRQRLLSAPTMLDEQYQQGRVPEPLYEDWKRRMRMSEAEFERHLLEKWPDGPKRLPEKWLDPDFSNPSQPVVGISWFEADAYCRWLASQTGEAFRLPTDAEWEAAARGREGRVYAWGDTFDATRCNVADTRLRRPSPVGVFVEGESPEGVSDLTGNVFEWTASMYSDDENASEARSMRGGAWSGDLDMISTEFRMAASPDRRSTNGGLRVVVGAIPPQSA